MDELQELKERVNELEIYVEDLLDDECPSDYKRVIRSIINK